MAMPRIEVVITQATPSTMELKNDLQVVAIGKELIKVCQREDALLGRDAVVKKTDERVDQKNDEEGPQAGVAKEPPTLAVGPDSRLAVLLSRFRAARFGAHR